MKCRDCGGELYHYPGCNIGDHGDLVGDTEGAPMPDAPGDEMKVTRMKFFADGHVEELITEQPPATDTPAETRDDTARLNWIEAQGCLGISLNKIGQRPEFWDIDQSDRTLGTGATLREAIDAAMSAALSVPGQGEP